MDEATRARLAAINRDFYDRHAAEFSRRRSRPWAGWTRVLELAGERWGDRPPSQPDDRPTVTALRILDVGCGNGRLFPVLEERLTRPFTYLGVDESAPLVRLASERYPQADFRCLDVTAEGELERLADAGLSFIALFGLLHHLPGFTERRRLLERLVALLEPAGLLALSFWQFTSEPRLRRRILPWEEHNRTARQPIDTAELEPGDYLLRWGESGSPGASYRYCHHADPAEAERLVTGLGLHCHTRFTADGHSRRLNLYLLLERVD